MRANRLDAPRVEQGNQGAEDTTPGNRRRNHRHKLSHQIRRIMPRPKRITATTPTKPASWATIPKTAEAVTLRPSHLREQDRRQEQNRQHYADHKDAHLIAVEYHGGRPC